MSKIILVELSFISDNLKASDETMLNANENDIIIKVFKKKLIF